MDATVTAPLPRPTSRVTRGVGLLVFAALLLTSAPWGAHAAAPAPAPAAVDDDLDDDLDDDVIEMVDVAVTAAPVASGDDGGALGLLGRFHPALVHVPIGWLLMVVLLDFVTFVLRREGFERAGYLVLVGTALSFVPAIATGLMRDATYASPASVQALIDDHALVMFFTAGATFAALGLRTWRRGRLTGAARATYLGLVAVAGALVALGGHLGGKAVFGEDFLPF